VTDTMVSGQNYFTNRADGTPVANWRTSRSVPANATPISQ
jgi:hypothetical protein